MTSRSDCVQYTDGTNTPYERIGSGTNYVTQKEMSHARARSVKRRCDLLFQEAIDQSAPGYLSDLLHKFILSTVNFFIFEMK